jgi:hypothetical protein
VGSNRRLPARAPGVKGAAAGWSKALDLHPRHSSGRYASSVSSPPLTVAHHSRRPQPTRDMPTGRTSLARSGVSPGSPQPVLLTNGGLARIRRFLQDRRWRRVSRDFDVEARSCPCGPSDLSTSPVTLAVARRRHRAGAWRTEPIFSSDLSPLLLLAVNLNVARDAFGHRDRSRERDPAQLEAVLAYLGT